MPELIYPGVYVDESTSAARPISGVPASTDDLLPLVDEWVRAVRVHMPEWTGDADGDPGVTLIELFAFLADRAVFRANEMPQRARVAAARLARSLDALARPILGVEPLQRPNYFSGRLLDAAALAAEQEYHREKRRRLNRAIFGYGIVSGLDVHVDSAGEGAASRVIVSPGFGIAVDGEQLALPCGVNLMAPAHGDAVFVTLGFVERAHSPVPMADGSSRMSMTEEGCVVGLHAKLVAPAIALARLVRAGAGWQVDAAFVVPRIA